MSTEEVYTVGLNVNLSIIQGVREKLRASAQEGKLTKGEEMSWLPMPSAEN